ncbi:MAG: TlpA disulfide reductase family protein [Actinomycetaceae bacterium]|nr:TlpA disulfide reductase family protein [Actinomycetaceae bacterium]
MADWRARIRESKYGTWVVLLVTTAIVVVGAWAVSQSRAGDDSAESAETAGAVSQIQVDDVAAAPKVGEPAPDFTFTDSSGKTMSLSDLQGEPVWLVFAATWCQGCRAEMPDVQAAFEANEDLNVLTVFTGESPDVVEPYAQRMGLTFQTTADADTQASRLYGVLGIPAHYFIDSEGVLREHRVGILSEPLIAESLKSVQ